MKFAPIPVAALTTPVTVVVKTGQSVYGGTTDLTVTGLCRFEEKVTHRMDAEKRLITLAGCIYMSGDIAPLLPAIEGGDVTIGGRTWQIDQAERPKNPDGTVHHTKLTLR